MAETLERSHGVELLHYRPWRGELAGSGEARVLGFLAVQTVLLILLALIPSYPLFRLIFSALFIALWGLVVYARGWPIARSAIVLLLKRWQFWVIFSLAMLVFMLFFFSQYLLIGGTEQLGAGTTLGSFLRDRLKDFAKALSLDGSAKTYRNYISFEAWPVMILLTLAGSVLIGNDLRFGSLPFYLSKPISRWDYVIGKGIAVAFVINLITTVPAILLWLEYAFVDSEFYFYEHLLNKADLLVGILGYGMVLTVTLTPLLLATATWLRKTVPLIMVWVTMFVFTWLLTGALAGERGLNLGARWRLLDLWNCTYLVGHKCLGLPSSALVRQPQPEWYEAALVLTGVVALCVTYLIVRIRAVEVVQ